MATYGHPAELLSTRPAGGGLLASAPFFIEIWMPGAPRSRFSHGMYCKEQLFIEIVFYRVRVVLFPVFGSLGYGFRVFAALGRAMKFDGYLMV